MVQIFYAGGRCPLEIGESVLDCLLRTGNNIPHSCKAGVCQTCLMKMVDGKIPAKAQEGLKSSFKEQSFFLACQCYPDGDIDVQLPDEAVVSTKATIIEKSFLNHTVLYLRLRLDAVLECRAGQYVNLINPDGVSRSYSIANVLANDGYIELHIRIIPNGKMSLWLQQHAKVGDEVTVRGAMGDCFYITESDNNYPIILAGTGTGLAPLYGIITDALKHEHNGKIMLYHGGLKPQDLYYVEELKKLNAEHNNFTYIPCVLNGDEGKFYRVGNIEDIVISALPEDKNNVRLYLCGAPDMVNSLRVKAFLAGVSPDNIHLDEFLPSSK